uniref:Tripartite motif-containing protein 43-like n=1 Tax=Sus scrofa TaxID=9823 RepID=A0A8D0ZG27_PIG
MFSFFSSLRIMGSKSFQNEFTCSLCDKYFIDPVTLGCGHSFCMPCLCLSWEEEAQHPPQKSHQMNLKTNIVLMTRIFLARRTGPYDLPSPEEQTCETHMKPKNFYCEVTKDVLCLPCSKTKEHVAHLHCSIEWTAEEYRQKLLKQMRCLWVKIQQNERNLRRETSKIRNWEVSRKLVSFSTSLGHVGIIQENRELKITFRVCSEWLQEQRLLSNHRWLSGPDRPGVDNTPTRLKYFLAWGAESFTSGQHYWEVNMAGCCNWAIGLCNDSWAKKNDMALESEGIFLLFCIQENQQCSLFTSSPLTPQYVQRPLGQVGVFLDHEAGLVSFIDVATSSLICSFLSCSFSSSLKAFLCSGHP